VSKKRFNADKEYKTATFEVGNDAESIDDETTEWTAFVRPTNTPDIAYVDFALHPTFSPSEIRVDSAPWEITRQGWGEFEIGITVHFEDEGRDPAFLVWELNFDGGDSREVKFVDHGSVSSDSDSSDVVWSGSASTASSSVS